MNERLIDCWMPQMQKQCLLKERNSQQRREMVDGGGLDSARLRSSSMAVIRTGLGRLAPLSPCSGADGSPTVPPPSTPTKHQVSRLL